jgi:transposase
MCKSKSSEPVLKFVESEESVVILCARARDSGGGADMWTDETRSQYERKGARYPSDLTDGEWQLVEPHLPPPRKPRGQRGKEGKPPIDRREVLNTILYLLTTGCQWRQLPKDLLPRSTVHNYLMDWRSNGVLAKIHYALYVEARKLAGREPSPTQAIVDSQSVKRAEKGGLISIRLGTMQAKRSKARSGMRPSTTRAF